jgi:hypothetical protein
LTAALESKLRALVGARFGQEIARRALGATRAVAERGDMAEAFREFGVVQPKGGTPRRPRRSGSVV